MVPFAPEMIYVALQLFGLASSNKVFGLTCTIDSSRRNRDGRQLGEYSFFYALGSLSCSLGCQAQLGASSQAAQPLSHCHREASAVAKVICGYRNLPIPASWVRSTKRQCFHTQGFIRFFLAVWSKSFRSRGSKPDPCCFILTLAWRRCSRTTSSVRPPNAATFLPPWPRDSRHNYPLVGGISL